MKRCPNCRNWDLAQEDIYCAWCGHRLISVEARLKETRFLVRDLPPPLDLELTNRSEGATILVQTVEGSEPWIQVEKTSGPGYPLKLAPGQTAILTVRLHTQGLADTYHSGAVLVSSNVGTERIALELVPAPEFSVSTYVDNHFQAPCRLAVILDNRNLERHVARVHLKRGVVTVLGIDTDQPWAGVRLPAEYQTPFTLDARRHGALDLMFEIDEALLIATAATYPFERTFQLHIECPELTHKETVTVRCWKPAALWIWEESKLTIDSYIGQPSELTLTLQNSIPGNPSAGIGNATLLVSRIEIRTETGENCSWIEPAEKLPDVIAVAGGENRRLRYRFNPGDANGPAVGTHLLSFVLTTNLPEVTRRISFQIQVREIREYPGILAIDFGTSNTCCAMLGEEDEEHRLVAVDNPVHNPSPTTTPTIIRYLERRENGVRTEIGAGIDALPLSGRVLRSTARSIKLQLGSGKQYELLLFNSGEIIRYGVRDVVAHYLAHVRDAAERQQRGARFNKIVITHPSRFRLNQILELTDAVRQAFGADCEIDTLPEPVAAALGFVVADEEALARSEPYTVAVFDFGGGTTDLSLIQVQNRHRASFMEVRPRQLTFTGFRFGGEDITKFIYDAGLKRIEEIVTADRLGGNLLVDSEALPDGNMAQTAIENHGRLLQWSELTKLALIYHGDKHLDRLPVRPELFPLQLALWNNGPIPRAFAHDQIVPRQAAMEEWLRARLGDLAGAIQVLVDKSGVHALDYIWLSGKSSAIPLVSQVLGERFPSARIRRAAEPKECVVGGACLPYKLRRSSNVVLVIEDADFVRTTSRLGIEETRGGKFMFREVIELGTPVLESGIKRDIPDYPLRLDSRIRLLENTDPIHDTVTGNPDVVPVCTFTPRPDSGLSRQPVPARLELHLSSDFQPALTAYIEGRNPVSFIKNHAAHAQGGA